VAGEEARRLHAAREAIRQLSMRPTLLFKLRRFLLPRGRNSIEERLQGGDQRLSFMTFITVHEFR
jgi:hypothetical protein